MSSPWKQSALAAALLALAVLPAAGAAQTPTQRPEAAAQPAAPTQTPRPKNPNAGGGQNPHGVEEPLYTYYAAKIKEWSGVNQGLCMDVGSGVGSMAIAMARITDLNFILLDISEPSLERAKQFLAQDKLEGRVKTLLGNVQDIPLPDNSINLAISRGSIPFWKDPVKGMQEIYRVLAPGGKAYIGVGRGGPVVAQQMEERRKLLGLETTGGPQRTDKPSPRPEAAAPQPAAAPQSAASSDPTGEDSDTPAPRRPQGPGSPGGPGAPGRTGGPGGVRRLNFEQIMESSGIKSYTLYRAEDGMFIQMWK